MSEPSTARTEWLPRALPAATFLVGLLTGGVFVAVAADPGGPASDSPGPGTATQSTSPAAASDTTVVVPAACSRAADAVSEAINLFREGAGSVRDFQPEELIRVLDDLETLDPKLQRLAMQCSQVEVSPESPTATTGPTSPTD